MKPATPLPWNVVTNAAIAGEGDLDLVAETANGICADDGNAKDAAYTVHACNAYPELVAALRMIVQAASDDKLEDFTRTSNAADAAHSLLAKLGEAE